MSDGFTELIDRALAFFKELDANNTKDWYEPRKEFYRDEIKKPAELLLEILRDDISRETGTSVKGKLFRIHRDVRFSKDKTPYNTHLHIMWSAPKDTTPVWFFGASPSYVMVGMGLFGLKGDSLTRFRAMVDTDGDALQSAIDGAHDSVDALISSWGPEPLKRVPKPYDPDHPHADLLKRKSLTLGADLPPDWRDIGLQPAILGRVRGLKPVWEVLNETFG